MALGALGARVGVGAFGQDQLSTQNHNYTRSHGFLRADKRGSAAALLNILGDLRDTRGKEGLSVVWIHLVPCFPCFILNVLARMRGREQQNAQRKLKTTHYFNSPLTTHNTS